MKRRQALKQSSLAAIWALSLPRQQKALAESWDETLPVEKPKHLLSSSLFGYTPIEEILPIAKQIGIRSLDVWPKVHGNQREQLAQMGEKKFTELLSEYGCKLDCLTQYPLGPFGLDQECRLAKRLDCHTIVTGSGGPKGLNGPELKQAIWQFMEKLKPHLEVAQECGVTLAIENHANSLLDTPDSLRWFAQMRPSENLAIAFAPYHLPQDEQLLSNLVRDVLPCIEVFYAWQHGKGSMQAQPKSEERLQLPGRGPLDFLPVLKELRRGMYNRWIEVFMHPFPRGIPIAESLNEVAELMIESKSHIDRNWQAAQIP